MSNDPIKPGNATLTVEEPAPQPPEPQVLHVSYGDTMKQHARQSVGRTGLDWVQALLGSVLGGEPYMASYTLALSSFQRAMSVFLALFQPDPPLCSARRLRQMRARERHPYSRSRRKRQMKQKTH